MLALTLLSSCDSPGPARRSAVTSRPPEGSSHGGRTGGSSQASRADAAVTALSAAPASSGEPAGDRRQRIVAIGDVHGDLAATRAALQLGGLIDPQDHWIGGTSVAVQLGDFLDRGDGERAIMELLEGVAVQAAAAGGRLHVILGNHEVKNVAGDFRYVTKGGFADFADLGTEPSVQGYPPDRRGRYGAFLPGRPYARKLARYPVILTLEGNVFVHGGLLPRHLDYGIERINREVRTFFLEGTGPGHKQMLPWDSPVNSRHYAKSPGDGDCHLLSQVLERLAARRMIVAHTPQFTGSIESYCGDRVYAVDVGLSSWGGGYREVLEIVGDEVRVIAGPRPDAGAHR